MKVLLPLFLASILTFPLSASHGPTISTGPTLVLDNPTGFNLSLQNIFFADTANEVLFIDFEAIGDQLQEVNILRGEALMMEDDVSDLPTDSIYEINLDIIREGTYTIELVTVEGIVVHKEIWVE
ncbi:MAG: hypothetical protein AAFW73_12535 [Bacteroidota bacterium]